MKQKSLLKEIISLKNKTNRLGYTLKALNIKKKEGIKMRTILDDLKLERRRLTRMLRRNSLRESQRADLEYELTSVNISIGNLENNR